MKPIVRKLSILVTVIWLVSSCGIFSSGLFSLADTNVQVTLAVPASAAANSDFTVNVNISLVIAFDACNYDVIFDPTALELKNVTSGKIAAKVIPIDPVTGWNQINPGQYRIVQNISGFSGVSGSGYLAVLHFHNISSEDRTVTISLSNGTLGNTQAEAIPATWSGGTVNVVGNPPPSTPSPTPGTTPPADTPTPSETPTTPTQTPTPTPAPSPTPTPTPSPSPTPIVSVTSLSAVMDTSSRFTQDMPISTSQGNVRLIIGKDTTAQTADKKPLPQITISKIVEPPTPQAGTRIVGSVYEFGPSGATFNPAITLTLTYFPADVPVGFDERKLAIAYWDASAGNFTIIQGCIVDRESYTIKALVSHFTLFSVVATTAPVPTIPPAFTVSDMAMSSNQAVAGEVVTITAMILNSGGSEGSYDVLLKVSDITKASKAINLAPGESRQVVFDLSISVAGSYAVSIDKLTSTLTVKPLPSPLSSPSPTTAPSPEQAILPPSSSAPPSTPPPSPEAAPTSIATINWHVLWGVIGLVVIAIGLVLFFRARSRSGY